MAIPAESLLGLIGGSLSALCAYRDFLSIDRALAFPDSRVEEVDEGLELKAPSFSNWFLVFAINSLSLSMGVTVAPVETRIELLDPFREEWLNEPRELVSVCEDFFEELEAAVSEVLDVSEREDAKGLTAFFLTGFSFSIVPSCA